MGLKDKAKNIWKRVSDLDDEKGSANGLSKEKDRISYKDISKNLKDVMKQNVDVVGRKIIIPGYYAIYFNEADRKMRIEVEDVLCDELKEELYHEMRKINPEQNKRDLFIDILTDPALENGAFRIEHHIKKPEAGGNILKEKAPAQAPGADKELDFQQTVVEQSVPQPSDDAQTVVMQRSADKVLYTLTIDSGEEKREVNITKERVSIGRGSADDVNLPSPDFSISRAHTVITVKDEGYYLTPSGVNGTFLNGKELALNEETAVSAGDEIKIMNYTLKIIEP